MTETHSASLASLQSETFAGPVVTVRVPATAANLGPGYDCFGLALQRYDDLSAALRPAGLRVDVEGVGAGQVPTDAGHLVIRAMQKAWRAVDLVLPAVFLRCRNAIPHGGGQGSSAAAIVAGLLLGRGLLPADVRAELPDSRVLQLATDLEGHPDNVAPALLGGFTIAWTAPDGRAAAVRREVHPQVRAVMFAASQTSATEQSRTFLPHSVPHADAAANSACAALLVHAMTADPSYLFEATHDRLHQPYRAASMPSSTALLAELREAGIAAVISGAGPSVLALFAGDMSLERWQRAGFAVQQVSICATGATVGLT